MAAGATRKQGFLWSRPSLTALSFLALAVPVAVYFWFIGHYALNVIYYDSWSDVNLIAHPWNLWNQHNEQRVVFPNFIVLLLGNTVHFNTLVEDYLNGVMLMFATGLFVWTHKRRSPSTPWIYYLPVAIVMLSIVQAGSTLWGVQLAWYLVMLALAVTLYFLDRPTMTNLVMAAAIAAAVVGSFSSLMGLFIWPVGLALLWHRRRSKGFVFAWVGSAVVSVFLYFVRLDLNQTYQDPGYLHSHPIQGIKMFFFVIGDVFGAQTYDNVGHHVPNAPNAGNGVVIFLGVVVFAIAAWAVIAYGFRRDETSGGVVGVALVCFGLLTAFSIAYGRTSPDGLGVSGGPSRYTTFTLLILAGTYLALLNRPTSDARNEPSDQDELIERSDSGAEIPANGQAQIKSRDRRPYLVVLSLEIVAICLLIVMGTVEGIAYGRFWHQNEVQMADVTVNLNQASNVLIDDVLFPGGSHWVRLWAPIATERHLSLFATGAVAHYTKEGLFREFGVVSTRVAKPVAGATLSGGEFLDAGASCKEGVTKVEFRLTGGDLHDAPIGTATHTVDGWIAGWNTASVPNGIYTLESVAFASNGLSAHSTGIVVTVKNEP